MGFVVAVAVAGGLALLLARGVSRHLKVSTDIVGYPIYNNFNIARYIDYYYIAVLFFPIAALVLYLAQMLLARRFGLTKAAAPKALAVETPMDVGRVTASAVSRVLAVGALFGLEATIIANASGASFWAELIAITAVYSTLVMVAGMAFHRRMGAQPSLTATAARINTLAAPVTVLGLFGVSAAQTITIQSDGSVHHYPWLPLWLAVVVAGATIAWLWSLLSGAKTDVAVRGLERKTLLFLAAPLALFILVSQLIANPGTFDMFHEGEWIVAARLTGAGWLYWRDLLSTHGLFQDGLAPLLGMRLFENSRWGLEAGRSLLVDPLAWVSLFVLLAWLCERSWAVVLAFFALIAVGQLGPFFESRFIFWPLVLLLLAVSLQRRRWWLSVLLAISLVIQAILVPESAYCVLACGLVVFLHDLYHRRKGAKLIAVFSQTLWLTAGGVAAFAVFCLYLISQHALGDFFFYYAVFAPGHELTGGVPVGFFANGPLFPLQVFATPVALLLGILYYAKALIQRRPLDTRDWVVAASALVALPYYLKFIDRADGGHVIQVLDMTYPLIVYLIYRACLFADSRLTRSRLRERGRPVAEPVAVALLVTTLATMVTTNPLHTAAALPTWLMGIPDRYHQVAATEPELATVGYGSGNNIDTATVADLATVFKAYLGPNDWVFDFSNEPALIYYVLGQTPRTRYYHVTMAIPQLAQKDLINELKQDPPKLVVFSNLRFYGLPAWDSISNMVRHYDVSQYILDNYTPLLSTHTQLIYGLTSANLSSETALSLHLQEPALTTDLPFQGFPCDWGYAPNFLSISPPPSPHHVAPVTLITDNEPNAGTSLPMRPGKVTGFVDRATATHQIDLALPSGSAWSDYRWMEIDTSTTFAQDQWVVSDVTTGDRSHQITFGTLPTSAGAFRVYIGNCTQWHGYQTAHLILRHSGAENITAVRLLP